MFEDRIMYRGQDVTLDVWAESAQYIADRFFEEEPDRLTLAKFY